MCADAGAPTRRRTLSMALAMVIGPARQAPALHIDQGAVQSASLSQGALSVSCRQRPSPAWHVHPSGQWASPSHQRRRQRHTMEFIGCEQAISAAGGHPASSVSSKAASQTIAAIPHISSQDARCTEYAAVHM